jgi:hypothetical protein
LESVQGFGSKMHCHTGSATHGEAVTNLLLYYCILVLDEMHTLPYPSPLLSCCGFKSGNRRCRHHFIISLCKRLPSSPSHIKHHDSKCAHSVCQCILHATCSRRPCCQQGLLLVHLRQVFETGYRVRVSTLYAVLPDTTAAIL